MSHETEVRRFSRAGSSRTLRAIAMPLALMVVAAGLMAPALAQSQVPTPSSLDWRYYGNDLGNMRYQDVDQINPSNVADLQPAWIFHTGVLDPKASFEVSPLVVNGTMYISTGHDDVFALDAATGAEKWSYHPLAEMPPLDQIAICCGRDSRGVAYDNGKVFLARLDDVLVALDANTGAVVWKTTVVDFHDKFAMTMAPQIVNGLVIVGVAGGEFEVRGQVVAYDAETGKEAWRFFATLPGPTWAGKSWQTGGGPVWTTPSVDPALGLLYITTGNAAPDLNGIHRAGQNLYTCSIVALDIFTGKVRWYFQEVHHDLWDYDATQPTILFTLEKDGKTFPAIGHANKNGHYYILDRRDGTPLHPVTEVPVPSTQPAWQHAWPTQPASAVEPIIPRSVVFTPPGFTSAPEYTPPQPQELVMQPGPDGGAEWTPDAFSPRTGFIYRNERYLPTAYSTSPNNTQGFASMAEEDIPGIDDFGVFGATDSRTGKVVWKIHVDQPAKSGLVVAGDLAFFGEGNGKFHAVNAATGDTLWTFDGTSVPNGGGANAAPIAYVVGGREFVANAFGGNSLDQEFPPNPTGDAVIAFALPQTMAHARRVGAGPLIHRARPFSGAAATVAVRPGR